MTPPKKELLLSILAMDAYNRGYGAGLRDQGAEDPDGLGEGGAIGRVTMLRRDQLGASITDYAAWQSTGFYAIAYELTEAVGDLTKGTMIISIRGTDQPNPFDPNQDIQNGYGIGAGFANGPQARQAVDFYKSVVASMVDGKSAADLTRDDLVSRHPRSH